MPTQTASDGSDLRRSTETKASWGMEKGRKGFEEEKKKGGCRGCFGGWATDNREEPGHSRRGAAVVVDAAFKGLVAASSSLRLEIDRLRCFTLGVDGEDFASSRLHRLLKFPPEDILKP
ncbi:hypothetical protein EYF80_031923 [Liparis tanakae]|uniref:Uncharacterized protein n=1 Tax=Liparis tanakae TaxID=230148 RepID=A0A4Z2GX11_9TELE|nr:hypothetical protein EYF80_031923 [Liparis tanakae]